MVADRLVGSLFHCLSVAGKKNGKGLGSLSLHVETVRQFSSSLPGFPSVAPLACHQHILVFCLCSRRSRIWLLVAVLSSWLMSFWRYGVPSSRNMFHNGPYHGGVGNGLDFGWAVIDVSSQEAKDPVCFSWHYCCVLTLLGCQWLRRQGILYRMFLAFCYGCHTMFHGPVWFSSSLLRWLCTFLD